MKMTRKLHYLLALLAAVLVLAACDAGAQEDTPAAAGEARQNSDAAGESAEDAESPADEAEAESAAESAAAEALALSATHTFPGFGFSIDHPADWFVETRSTITAMAESEEDVRDRFRDASPSPEGLGLTLDHRDQAFMSSIGLAEDPSLEDLLELNKEVLEYPEDVEAEETDLFGSPALKVMVMQGDGYSYSFMGFVNDRAFLLSFIAPTEQELDDHMATWEQMLASIQPVEE